MFCCVSCLAKAKTHNFCLLKSNSDSKEQNVAALISEKQLFLLKQVFCLCLDHPEEKICCTVEELLAIICNMLFIGELLTIKKGVCLSVFSRSLSHVLVTFLLFNDHLIISEEVLQKDLFHFNPHKSKICIITGNFLPYFREIANLPETNFTVLQVQLTCFHKVMLTTAVN